MYCNNCGAEIIEGNSFCTNCGEPIANQVNINENIEDIEYRPVNNSQNNNVMDDYTQVAGYQNIQQDYSQYNQYNNGYYGGQVQIPEDASSGKGKTVILVIIGALVLLLIGFTIFNILVTDNAIGEDSNFIQNYKDGLNEILDGIGIDIEKDEDEDEDEDDDNNKGKDKDKDEDDDEDEDEDNNEGEEKTTTETTTETTTKANKVNTYTVITADISWTEAKQAAEDMGGHLATITSQEEYDAICLKAAESGLKYLWIGARINSESDSYSTWITGETFNFAIWYPGEPTKVDKDGTQEYYLCLWNVKSDSSNYTWTFNDQRNDLASLPKLSGKIGYIVEFE